MGIIVHEGSVYCVYEKHGYFQRNADENRCRMLVLLFLLLLLCLLLLLLLLLLLHYITSRALYCIFFLN